MNIETLLKSLKQNIEVLEGNLGIENYGYALANMNCMVINVQSLRGVIVTELALKNGE